MISVYRLFALIALAASINAQCEFASPDGDYKASWYLDSATQIVHFKLSAKQRQPAGFWTGIGFGGKMQGGDIITVSSVNNQVTVADRQGIGFSEPVEDTQQDVKNFKGRLENGVIQAEFTRAVDTGDAQDLPIIDKTKNNCQDFIFPVSGGAASQTAIQKHANTPTVQKICHIDQCTAFAGATGTGQPAGEAGTTTPSRNGLTTENAAGSQTTNGHIGTTTLSAILSGGQTTAPPFGGSAINQGAGTTGKGEEASGTTVAGKPAAGSSCSFTEGDYSASWAYDQATQSVRFTINAPLSLNKWTGIGFGQTMQGGDMIIVSDANGVISFSDRHGIGHAEPLVDAHQDVQSFTNTYNGKTVQAEFTRKINTGDVDDLPLEDSSKNNCQYFMFPVSGGILNVAGTKTAMSIHKDVPITKLICGLSSCTSGAAGSSVTGGAVGVTQSPAGGETTPNPAGQPSGGNTPQPPIGSSGIGGESRPCPPRDDHSACKNYIDDYLNVVYTKFPKSDQITQKACGLLQTHQTGVVYTECCHYLSQTQVCGRFIGQQGPQPVAPQQPQPGGSPQQPQPGGSPQQPQPGGSPQQPQPGGSPQQPQPGGSPQQPQPGSASQPQPAGGQPNPGQNQPGPNNNVPLQQPQNHNGLPGRAGNGK